MSNRKQVEHELQAKVKEGEAAVERLKARLNEASGDARQEVQEALDAAQQTLKNGKTRLNRMLQASDDEFDKLWADSKAHWHEFSNDVADGWQNLSANVKKFFS